MSAKPEISVVLVTFNRAYVLPRTLDSILSQTFSNFELIVCDDHSTDSTEEICLKYAAQDARIKYVRNAVNIKMPANLIKGIERSQCELIANLHDGDIYHPDLLRLWRDCLLRHPKAAFVFNAYRALDQFGNERCIYREELLETFSGHTLIEDVYFRRWRFDSPVWGTVMARRSAYYDVGLFQERFTMYSDVDMWLRLAEIYDVCYLGMPLIDLPSRESVPRLFSFGVRKENQIIARMFWEARIRHYRNKPLSLFAEVLRHGIFVLASRSYERACWLKAKLGMPKNLLSTRQST